MSALPFVRREYCRTLRQAFYVLALSATPIAPAHAFGYAEHCRMSNRALILAVQHVRAQNVKLVPAQIRQLDLLEQAARTSRCDQNNRAASQAYGDHVARVDWALNPADFFLTATDSTPGAISVRETDRVPADAIAALRSARFQGYRLMKENSEHFGARALFSFDLWHRKALDVAHATAPSAAYDSVAARRVAVALVYNAFADHYLEDLFAPGHVASPRGGLQDHIAGGLHDYHNSRGAYFRPTGSAQLRGFLPPSKELPLDSVQPSLATLVGHACNGSEGDACVAATFAPDSLLLLHGDNSLDAFAEKETLRERGAKQELYITLVIARSVHEVLTAWLTAGSELPQTTFTELRACGYGNVQEGPKRVLTWEYPNIVTPYGYYAVESDSGLPPGDKWPVLRAATQIRSGRDVSLVVGFEGLWRAYLAEWLGVRPDLHGTQDASTHLGLDARFPLPGSRSGDGFAIGPTVRGTWAYNRINAQGSLVAGVRGGARLIEAHAAPSVSIGFALLHLDLRPGVAVMRPWGSSARGSYMAFTLQAGLMAIAPRLVRRPKPRQYEPPSVTAVSNVCRGHELRIGS